MALSTAKVTEVATAVKNLCDRLGGVFAEAHRVIEMNSDVNIQWTPATKTATFANATDIWTSTAHGFAVDQKVRLTNSGGALPAGFSTNTDYWVISSNLAANTFMLSATKGGATVNGTTDGTGTHTVNPVPDYITEDASGNLSGGFAFDRVQVANALGSFTQLRNYFTNAAVTQGDHLGNINQVANATG